MSGGTELIPEDTILKDGRLWRDMSLVARTTALGTEPYLQRMLPQSWRDSRAALLRRCRNERFQQDHSGL